jgi:Delta14-sterol reductase
MRWAGGYLLLWLACGVKLGNDFLPTFRELEFVFPTLRAWSTLTGYIFVLAVVSGLLPGKLVPGVPLKDTNRALLYKINGLLLLGVTIVSLAACVWNGYISGSWIADHHAELFATANVLALLLSTYLFVVGRLSRPKNWLRVRSVYEDFVMGAELNPHVLGVNMKFFSYRPSMIGWLLINLSFLCKQYETLGFVTSRMLLYQVLTAWYVWDYFVHESKMVTTWDIIAEHFGLMLVWGDYVLIPFGFSVQNFFLLRDLRPMSLTEVIGILFVFAFGFSIFRGANTQKHKFKTNPTELIWGKPPIVVGGKLLASGFWGMARHMNYTGDLLLAISYCLPCGVSSGSVPYFYFVYLLLLIVHREKRDDERCSAKYRSLWDEYCLRVPYRMIPFVY